MSTAQAVPGAAAGANLTRKDFTSDQDVRWCPGCGDYAILSQVQKVMPELGIPRENIVFVSGIGCSSRFPYYMNTYGFHSIHGRAPAVASGVKLARPELSVWIVTGDGDGLSIGGNHLIHILRRNLDVNILLFNNEIYGLTKGQYSPTSRIGQVTKSSPMGVVDPPFNAAALALGAGATFVARSMDVDQKHLQSVLLRAAQHKGTSFVEILQNCPVFNDGAFANVSEKDQRAEHQLLAEHGQPLRFGAGGSKGFALRPDLSLEVVDADSVDPSALLVHDERNPAAASLLARLASPVAMGVLHAQEEGATACYEERVSAQIEAARARKGPGDFDALYASGETWTV
jgi:2-oxoglutarate ferredoxin oxidoreductase subunit beta